MIRKNRLTVAAVIALLATAIAYSPANAEWKAVGGVERFNWREFDANGARLLEESGYRYIAGLENLTEGDAGLLMEMGGKVYGSWVNYDGQTNKGDPFTSKTGYAGWQFELKPLFRTKPALLEDHYLDYTASFGIDYWFRDIHGGTDINGGAVGGAREEYFITYLRLGFRITPDSRTKGWHGGAGLKKPVYTYEKAHLTLNGFDSDIIVRPEPDLSFYGEAGYSFNERWSVSLLYDSYNFKKSQTVTVSKNGAPWTVHQPKSVQYTIGLTVSYRFSLGKSGGDKVKK